MLPTDCLLRQNLPDRPVVERFHSRRWWVPARWQYFASKWQAFQEQEVIDRINALSCYRIVLTFFWWVQDLQGVCLCKYLERRIPLVGIRVAWLCELLLCDWGGFAPRSEIRESRRSIHLTHSDDAPIPATARTENTPCIHHARRPNLNSTIWNMDKMDRQLIWFSLSLVHNHAANYAKTKLPVPSSSAREPHRSRHQRLSSAPTSLTSFFD